MRTRLMLAAVFISLASLTNAPSPIVQDLKVTTAHPFLAIDSKDVERAQRLVQTDPKAKSYYEELRRQGQKAIAAPVIKLSQGRMLSPIRATLQRVYTLAGLYLLDGDRKWRDGAVKQAMALATLPDWTFSQFLDTAEAIHTVAIAYDWLYPTLNSSERATLRKAIVDKGLSLALQAYKTKQKWVDRDNNWNLVCHSAVIVGALAVAPDEPKVAQEAFSNARKNLERGFAPFGSDGGYIEGVCYWHYAVRYGVTALATIQNVGLSTAGLGSEGWKQTPLFRLYGVGPSGYFFNFADCDQRKVQGYPWLNWMARTYGDPIDVASGALGEKGDNPLSLFWFAEDAGDVSSLPTARYFPSANVAMARSNWTKNATFVGTILGTNSASHAHPEMGAFVLDMAGARFVSELGHESYDAPDRKTLYRDRTIGQNTITLDDQEQPRTGKGRLLKLQSDKEGDRIEMELSSGYPLASSVRRSFLIARNGRTVTVTDDFDAKRSTTYRWVIHTSAKATNDQKDVILTAGSQSVRLTYHGDLEGAFHVGPARDDSEARASLAQSNDKFTRVWFEASPAQSGHATFTFEKVLK